MDIVVSQRILNDAGNHPELPIIYTAQHVRVDKNALPLSSSADLRPSEYEHLETEPAQPTSRGQPHQLLRHQQIRSCLVTHR
jgi:hypothetical protein